MTDVETRTPEEEEPGRPAGMLRETRDSLRAVFRNPNLRRVQLAFAGSAIGDWAAGTAVAVWAYGVGGAKAVGIWMAIRLALMAVAAPFGATLADRMDRRRLMMVCDAIRAVVFTGVALCLFLDTAPWPIFVLATMAALLGSPFRVAQRALLPSIVDRPEELTASNGTSSTIESLAFFVGPALGALLLGVTTVQVVVLLNVLTFAWSMFMVVGIRPHRSAASEAGNAGDSEPASTEPEGEQPGFLSETLAGFGLIGRDRGLLMVTLVVSAQTIIAGASAVFVVVMADDILGTGARGMGFLDSTLGVGAIVGGVVAISRAGKGRLAADLAAGVALWSVPLLLITVWPHPLAAFAAMALLGIGNPLVDANMDTIIQRLAPDEVLGRVFGALEAALIATMSLGALVTPFLLDWIGLRWTFAVLATLVGGLVLLGLPLMLGIDSRLRAPASLTLLRAIDLFAPLPPGALDSLAGSLRQVSFRAGDVIVREGDEADRFFVVESGLVEVSQGTRVLRREGSGEYFGEIGLLRDVPRTATIAAVEDTVVQTLAREDFLRAVTGHRESALAAESVVTRRLAV